MRVLALETVVNGRMDVHMSDLRNAHSSTTRIPPLLQDKDLSWDSDDLK